MTEVLPVEGFNFGPILIAQQPFSALPWVVMLPLIAALLCFTLYNIKAQRVISLLLGIGQMLLTVWLASIIAEDAASSVVHQLGGWPAPLGIVLTLNGFSALLLVMAAVIGFAITVYSCRYFTSSEQERKFWPLFWLLLVALNGIFISSDIFNLYVMLEILGLSAVSLVAIQAQRGALQAALQYLLVGLCGSLLYLFGVALLYRTYGVLDINLLSKVVIAEPVSQLALTVITLGLLLKTALFPLHFWLPSAHSNAPAPVSAALSGLVIKGSFYLLFVFWFKILSPAATFAGATFLGVLGAIAIVWGSVKAFNTPRLKLVVAYSTVAQLGYLFVLFPLFFGRPDLAMGAVAYFIVAHACAKAAMFMAAGSIQKAAGHDDIARMSGIASKMPLSIFIFAIAGASLIGLPPTGGFIAKWLMLTSAIESQQWWWVLVMLAGGLLAAAYLFRILNLAFTSGQDVPSEPLKNGPRERLWGPLILVTITIFIGFNAMWVLELLNAGTGVFALQPTDGLMTELANGSVNTAPSKEGL